jgi:glycosyltransferase involved in cell wall biosynthesis
MTNPAVSVVVATQNRPQRLTRLLEALRAQDQPASRFEVIVVDDGSAPATAQVLDRELARGELRLRVARHPIARGAASARNTGWRLAQAELVAFTDDDCRPAASWLSAALELHRTEPEKIIQGRTEPDPDERANLSLISHTVTRTELGPSYETCNIFYPRSLLELLGGFDARYGPRPWPSGEDTDLAWRALESGYAAGFSPDALVFHAVERVGAAGKLRQATRWTPSIRVLADHPQTRVMLERGIFWNVWHYLLLRSAVALLGPRWLRRLVLARHMLVLRKRGRAAGAGIWAVPFLLLYDTIETVAVVRGAIRYRTLVL